MYVISSLIILYFFMLHYLHFSYTLCWYNYTKSFFINFWHLLFSTYTYFFVYLVFTNSYLITYIINLYELVGCYKSRNKFCYLYKYITLDSMVINAKNIFKKSKPRCEQLTYIFASILNLSSCVCKNERMFISIHIIM